ncbi:MAG: hypothetical protein EP329_10840 [Deltaproteobacteria bacterium]|nr:MAG: hypothetical protein EP329_10840 [Deltaproteobacteria bacterium]
MPLAACGDSGAPTCGAAGGTQQCICTNGNVGAQTCELTGAWAPCQCASQTQDTVTGDATTDTASTCTPDCQARDCGDDGCGGTCGTCESNEVCSTEGRCECVPECDARECGDDGCGGTCGACIGDATCTAGVCGVAVCLQECTDGPYCDSTGGGETTCLFEPGQSTGRCAFYYPTPGPSQPCASDAECGSDQACLALTNGTAYCTFKKTEPRGSTRCGSNGSCADGSQCEVVETGTQKIAFVTSTKHLGDFGGLQVGDEICGAAAAAAGLKGAFRVWLGHSLYVRTPSRRFTRPKVPYVRTDGTEIASGWVDLVDSSIEVPIQYDEFGTLVDDGDVQNVWTGVGADGDVPATTCQDWKTSAAAENGGTGKTNRWNDDWTSARNEPCNVARRLYCFEQ